MKIQPKSVILFIQANGYLKQRSISPSEIVQQKVYQINILQEIQTDRSFLKRL